MSTSIRSTLLITPLCLVCACVEGDPQGCFTTEDGIRLRQDGSPCSGAASVLAMPFRTSAADPGAVMLTAENFAFSRTPLVQIGGGPLQPGASADGKTLPLPKGALPAPMPTGKLALQVTNAVGAQAQGYLFAYTPPNLIPRGLASQLGAMVATMPAPRQLLVTATNGYVVDAEQSQFVRLFSYDAGRLPAQPDVEALSFNCLPGRGPATGSHSASWGDDLVFDQPGAPSLQYCSFTLTQEATSRCPVGYQPESCRFTPNLPGQSVVLLAGAVREPGAATVAVLLDGSLAVLDYDLAGGQFQQLAVPPILPAPALDLPVVARFAGRSGADDLMIAWAPKTDPTTTFVCRLLRQGPALVPDMDGLCKPVPISLGAPGTMAAIGDLDGDTLPDLVLATAEGLSRSVPEWTEKDHIGLRLEPLITTAALGSAPTLLAAGYINPDAALDLAVAVKGRGASGQEAIWLVLLLSAAGR